jgi:hypothetical protein
MAYHERYASVSAFARKSVDDQHAFDFSETACSLQDRVDFRGDGPVDRDALESLVSDGSK